MISTKSLGMIATFTALTAVLSQIRVPIPFPPPGFTYYDYQIPIVVVFLLIGPKYGVLVAFLNMLINFVFPVGPLGVLGPPYAFILTLTILFGIYTSFKIFNKMKSFSMETGGAKDILLVTATGSALRTIFMLPFDFILFGTLLSLAFGMRMAEAYSYTFTIMPGIIIFNFIVPLYVISIGYSIVAKIPENFKLKIRNKLEFLPGSK